MALGAQLKRLAKHSAIYGLGGLVSRILAVLLLPLYTRYLSPGDYGTVETLIALTTVLGILLRLGITSAFFRFYFDSPDPADRRLVLRTSFWFTMGMATIGLAAGLALSGEISTALFGSSRICSRYRRTGPPSSMPLVHTITSPRRASRAWWGLRTTRTRFIACRRRFTDRTYSGFSV